jgi:hypothetical protein
MTRNEFMATFYGPANKSNRERVCRQLGISSFAGVPLKRLGWAGFVNAVGDYYQLDVRNFTCEAAFIEALAAKVAAR